MKQVSKWSVPSIPPHVLSAGLLSCAVMACSAETATIADAEQSPPTGLREALTTVAVLDLGEGHELSFLSSDDGTVGVREMSPLGANTSSVLADPAMLEAEPLEVYLQLTPKDRAVPAALINSQVSDELLAQIGDRPVVQESLGVQPADMLKLRTKTVSSSEWEALCGSNGAALFEQQVCGATNLSDSTCISGLHSSYGRYDEGKHRRAAVKTVACASAVKGEVWRKYGGVWYEDNARAELPNHLLTLTLSYSLSYERFAGAYAYNPLNASGDYIRTWVGFW